MYMLLDFANKDLRSVHTPTSAELLFEIQHNYVMEEESTTRNRDLELNASK